jgi:hypothetical protein
MTSPVSVSMSWSWCFRLILSRERTPLRLCCFTSYEHANAERFVPREVRVEPLDGERVLVVSGLEPSKRIVTQGVELLNQIR